MSEGLRDKKKRKKKRSNEIPGANLMLQVPVKYEPTHMPNYCSCVCGKHEYCLGEVKPKYVLLLNSNQARHILQLRGFWTRGSTPKTHQKKKNTSREFFVF